MELTLAFPRSRDGRGVESHLQRCLHIFLGDFPELAQQLLCNVAPLRCRVAQVRGDGCVRAAPLLRRPPELRLNQEVSQAKGVSLRRARDLFVDVHTLGSKGAFVTKDELVGTLVYVKLLLRVSYDLVAVCLRLLDIGPAMPTKH